MFLFYILETNGRINAPIDLFDSQEFRVLYRKINDRNMVYNLISYSCWANIEMKMTISLSLQIVDTDIYSADIYLWKYHFPYVIFLYAYSFDAPPSWGENKAVKQQKLPKKKRKTVKNRFQSNKNCHERKTKYLINGEWAWKIQVLKLR